MRRSTTALISVRRRRCFVVVLALCETSEPIESRLHYGGGESMVEQEDSQMTCFICHRQEEKLSLVVLQAFILVLIRVILFMCVRDERHSILSIT